MRFEEDEKFVTPELWNMLWEAKSLAEEVINRKGGDLVRHQVSTDLIPAVFILARQVKELEWALERKTQEANYYREDGDKWFKRYMEKK